MINLYSHGGSKNHGCEAIVRSTASLLDRSEIVLHSYSPEEDIEYGLDRIVRVEKDTYDISDISFLQKFRSAVHRKVCKSDYQFNYYGHIAFYNRIHRGDVCISIGGDNYCYNGTDVFGYYNKRLHQLGAKTVLWGCSIEPEIVTKKEIADDLKRYDLITARETISYEAIRKVNKNTILIADPAFLMEPGRCELPSIFDNKVIGLNLSPLITQYESDNGRAFNNFKFLIEYILKETDYSIALIPHVVCKNNDDRTILNQLYSFFSTDGRIALIDDHNAPELKYIISNCELFVGARTHATIAAYSSFVPTLVLGYSVKSRGIALDLFGTDENYVIPVQSLANEDQLACAFRIILENKDDIRNTLKCRIPEYIGKTKESVQRIYDLEQK